MLIQVVRTGGFAGIERRAEVDTSARPDAQEWHALAAAAVADGRGAPLPGAAIPDGFNYEITVDGRTVHCAEPQLSEEQRDLISRVLKEGA
ncbi:protealysin inhibitor emfourin [Streptomyces sp. NPDC091272]|uniref:protealysin inhibitor emfourin n=1 Tax=Streptomyces sp. NPDC091272 TaxID=3365981 RepID=UPI0038092DE2